jgi:anti-sigma regulatory factor (Ser/Thr protein kinase)
VDTGTQRVISTLYLAAQPNAPALARALVRVVLRQWGLPEVIEDAELVATELATNAMQATNASEPSFYVNGMVPPRIIMVQLVLNDASLFVGVWDQAGGMPRLEAAQGVDEGGRGLSIVNELSKRWGWNTIHPYGVHKGKVVWAELSLPHAPVSPDVLPKRTAGTPAALVVPLDLGVLVRVRNGLRAMDGRGVATKDSTCLLA